MTVPCRVLSSAGPGEEGGGGGGMEVGRGWREGREGREGEGRSVAVYLISIDRCAMKQVN